MREGRVRPQRALNATLKTWDCALSHGEAVTFFEEKKGKNTALEICFRILTLWARNNE